jgi:hypothetical protein
VLLDPITYVTNPYKQLIVDMGIDFGFKLAVPEIKVLKQRFPYRFSNGGAGNFLVVRGTGLMGVTRV